MSAHIGFLPNMGVYPKKINETFNGINGTPTVSFHLFCLMKPILQN